MAKKSVSKNKSRSKSSSRKRTKRRVSYKKRKLNKPTKKTRKKQRTKRVMKGGGVCSKCTTNQSQINGIKTHGHMNSTYHYTYSNLCKECDTDIYCFIIRDPHSTGSVSRGTIKFKKKIQTCYLLSGLEFTNGETQGQGISVIPTRNPFVEFTLTIEKYDVVEYLINFFNNTSSVYYNMSLIKIKKKKIIKGELQNIPFQETLTIPGKTLSHSTLASQTTALPPPPPPPPSAPPPPPAPQTTAPQIKMGYIGTQHLSITYNGDEQFSSVQVYDGPGNENLKDTIPNGTHIKVININGHDAFIQYNS